MWEQRSPAERQDRELPLPIWGGSPDALGSKRWHRRGVPHASRRSANTSGGHPMPRYLVHRSFDDGLRFPVDATGRSAVSEIVAGNLSHEVTWVHSYVSVDDHTT